MRRTYRATNRYDYKVLSTIGTTEQEKYPLLKDSSDVKHQESQRDIEDSVHSENEGCVPANEMFQESHHEDIPSDDVEIELVDEVENSEFVATVEQDTSITNIHHSDESSNLESDQHLDTPSDDANSNQPSSSNADPQLLTTSISRKMDVNQLTVDEATVSEDIDDFLDENSVDEIGDDSSEYDSLAKRAEDFRSNYRSIHKQLLTTMGVEAYKEKYKESSVEKLELIKQYIKNLKHHKKKLHESAQSTKTKSDNAKYEFLKKEFDSTFKELTTYFITDDSDWEGLSDEDLTRRRQCLDGKEKILHSLSNTVRELVGMSPDPGSINSIIDNYESLRTSKNEYTIRLGEVVKNRQLDQKKAFNRSKLNIKLPKYKGYGGIDIYTFRNRFEKLHPASEIPKEHLPELLMNNFLENPALLLVKDAKDIDTIWKRLTEAYGDCKRLLANKVAELGDVEGVCKSKDPEKVIDGLSKVINLMRDLMQIATDHNLKQKLYHGDAMDRIHSLMGEGRFTRWVSISCDKNLSDEEQQWNELTVFLEKEIKVNQQKALWSSKKKKEIPSRNQPPGSGRDASHHSNDSTQDGSETDSLTCKICNATDHVQTNGPNGSKLIQYFVCKKFVDMTPAERFTELRSKNLCFQCLFPGANKSRGKHKEGKCQRDFICPHPSHSRYNNGKKHVLLCEEHKTEESNKEILDEYKRRCIARPNQVELPPFTQAILIHHNYTTTDVPLSGEEVDVESIHEGELSAEAGEFCPAEPSIDQINHAIQSINQTSTTLTPSDVPEEHLLPDIQEEAVYILQTIEVEGERYNIFYDNGCKKFVSRYSAIKRLGSRATLLKEGPIGIGGVGGMQMTTPHGIYQIKLPTRIMGDYQAQVSGTCMDMITEKFPLYPLDGRVEQDITAAYIESGGTDELPKVEPLVGGETDFMFGGAYLRYFPEQKFRMPSGLTIFESFFKNASGGYGVIGGNHSVFTEIEKWFHLGNQGLHFIETQLQIYHCGYQVDPDVRLLGYRETHIDEFDCYDDEPVHCSDQVFRVSVQSKLKRFHASQFAGSEIQYRCPKCRNCQPCKNCDEDMTIKEEIEQEKIEESVTIDTENRVVVATIPLIADPAIRLCPNKDIARKIYDQQVKKLNKNQADKESVIKSEAKLQALGYVAYVKDLSKEMQMMLATSVIQNFIP